MNSRLWIFKIQYSWNFINISTFTSSIIHEYQLIKKHINYHLINILWIKSLNQGVWWIINIQKIIIFKISYEYQYSSIKSISWLSEWDINIWLSWISKLKVLVLRRSIFRDQYSGINIQGPVLQRYQDWRSIFHEANNFYEYQCRINIQVSMLKISIVDLLISINKDTKFIRLTEEIDGYLRWNSSEKLIIWKWIRR